MSFTASLEEIVAANHNGLLGKAEHWDRVRLGDIAEILNGCPFPSSRFTRDRGVPLLRIRDVGRTSTDAYFDGDVDPQFLVQPGELVVGMDGDFNASRWKGPTAALNQRVCKITPDERVLDRCFLAYVLPGYLAAVNAETSAITVKHLSSKTVSALPIPLPPLAEQRRIVAALDEHLSDLDAAIAGLHRAQANISLYRDSVMRDACEGRLLGSGGTDCPIAVSPSSELLDRSRSATPPDTRELPDVPSGWSVVSLDQVMRRITSGSRDWSRYYDRGTGTFIMAQNVRPGRLDLTFRQAVDPPVGDRDRERSQVRVGDVLVTIVGANTGDTCLVPTELPEHYVCQSVALLRPLVPALGPWIALYLASRENGRRQFERYIYGAGRPHLSFDQLRMTAVLLPPLEEQPRILAEVERRLTVADRTSTEINAQIARAESLRRSILAHAFQGKLVPLGDQPASTLLERLRDTPTSVAPKPRTRGSRTPSTASRGRT